MENLKTVSALVKNILEHDHKARNTDNHLYLMVLEHYSGLRGIDIHAMTVPVFLKELDRRSFPGFETVRRSRQKVQATYPDLAPSEAVGKRRAKNEVVYVKHRYSEFLGFKMKVFRRADKYVIKSHVGDKQLEHARQKLVTQAKNIIHPRKEKHERGEISLYNSIVVGLQDYYRIATCISEDCSSLGRSVMTVLTNGLKERQGSRLVRNGRKLTVFESQKYGKSKSLRYAKGTDEPVYPISYIRHSIPLSRKRAINCYTPAGRKGLHDNLKINVNLMLALMRQPIGNRSVELADNRISLFSAQYGKCAVTGMPFLTTDEIHCHHIKPKKYGGNDSYENLVLINKLIHRLVHAETVETITYYLEVCNLNKKQMEKLNALRLKAGLGEIRGTQPLKTNKVDCNRL